MVSTYPLGMGNFLCFRPIVVVVFVCVRHTGELSKSAEPIEMSFERAELHEPKEPCIG